MVNVKKKMSSCEWCGGDIPTTNKRARFCSDRCRLANHRNQKREQKKAQANTVPMELVPMCRYWQDQGQHEILEHILFLYFLTHDVGLTNEVSEVAKVAFHRGKISGNVSSAGETFETDKNV